MKNSDQKLNSKNALTFAQEMHQAFVEWVKMLPFIKQDIPSAPDRDNPEKESLDRASAPRPTGGPSAGRSADNTGSHR